MIRIALAALLACGLSASPALAGPLASDQAFATSLSAVRTALLHPSDKGAQPFRLASSRERDVLVRLLRDPDPAVRKAALRALRQYVAQTSRVRDAVVGVYANANEEIEVRYEAAKTLVFVSGYSRVRDRLLYYAERGDDASLRSISYKALYTQTSATSRVRDRVLRAAVNESDKQVRLGAIWALFTASGDSRVRDPLVRMARYDRDEDVRIEALKSLYGAMGHSRVRDSILQVARDRSEKTAVRVPAVLLLSAVSNSRIRDTLKDMARYEKDPQLREAAILAMSPSDERIAEYFHLVRRTQDGRMIDPLAKE